MKLFGSLFSKKPEVEEPAIDPSRRHFLGSVFASGVAAKAAFGAGVEKPPEPKREPPPPPPQQYLSAGGLVYTSTTPILLDPIPRYLYLPPYMFREVRYQVESKDPFRIYDK